MKLSRKLLLLLLSGSISISLNGCSFISGLGSDNTPKPSPLTTFKPQLQTHTVWSADVGKGAGNDYLKLGPVLGGNSLYFADAKGKITAVNAATGRTMWQIDTDAPITSGPSVGDGLVVVGTANAHVIALDQTTGAVRWRVAVPNQVLAAPEVGTGRVIIHTVSGVICVLASANGQLLWAYDHTAPTMILRGGSTSQIAGNKVITGFADGRLAAFNLNDGALIWQQTIAIPQGASQVQQMVDIVANPIVSNGVIYVATYQGNIAALNLQIGQILWQQKISSYTGLVLGPRQVFITDAEGYVWAFARDTGKMVWCQTDLLHRVLSPPAMMGNTIVVADGEGYVHWLSMQDGHIMARQLVVAKQSIFAVPQVLQNQVYVVTQKGDATAIVVK